MPSCFSHALCIAIKVARPRLGKAICDHAISRALCADKSAFMQIRHNYHIESNRCDQSEERKESIELINDSIQVGWKLLWCKPAAFTFGHWQCYDIIALACYSRDSLQQGTFATQFAPYFAVGNPFGSTLGCYDPHDKTGVSIVARARSFSLRRAPKRY